MQARKGFARGVFALVGPSRSGGLRGNPAVARRRLAPGKKERLIFCDIDFELKVVIMSAKTRGD